MATLASLLSQWAFALLAGCLGFAFLYLALRSIPPAIRDKRLFWLVELAVLPLAVTFAAALPIALLGLTEANVWHGRVE